MAPRASLLLAAAVLAAVAAWSAPGAAATGVFQVRRKFPAGGGDAGGNISALRSHDGRRHGRLLSAADLPLGGLGLPTDTGLYFTEIKLGTPPKRYYVQVDTGSDILWVNCISCDRCPRKSGLGLDLTLYDPKASSSGSTVLCDQGFCAATYGGKLPGCTSNVPCEYSVMYGDGSSTTGFFVTDALQFDQVTGNGQTQPGNSSITFGCGAQQGGDLGSSNQALDGILGFGQANTSMLSQLAATGKVKKIFAHCLDTIKGGGIFAIGNVVQPKVKTTPLVADMPHYNVNLESVDVGGTTLELPAHVFETGDKKGTIIDSGTTLTYLPELVFKEVMLAVFNKHQDITFHNVQDFLCFQYSGSVDDGFPTITFHFEDDLALHVYPHEYFFPNGNDIYCVGFQNGALQSKDGKDIVLMGDLVLSNKLVVYDLENQVIGWTDYNCIIVAWKSPSVQVLSSQVDRYSVSVQFTEVEGCNWWFTGVYGPQEDDDKSVLLEEPRDIRALCNGPWAIAGDFNLIYQAADKNNNNLNRAMISRFRHLLDDLELKEIPLLGRRFTRSNERDNPTLVRLDCAFCSVEWEDIFSGWSFRSLSLDFRP